MAWAAPARILLLVLLALTLATPGLSTTLHQGAQAATMSQPYTPPSAPDAWPAFQQAMHDSVALKDESLIAPLLPGAALLGWDQDV
ncbi:MAG: hypothetical protein R3185_09620, partial [Candidatus Thermoplasmatota archaeon]|nr:hypothetical protein [Candidatus Thermoplasmatota archaeon]